MNKFKFTNLKENTATILLYGEIGGEVNGTEVAKEIHFLNEAYGDLDELVVKINSMGGNVQDGLSICSALLDSKIPVTTIINGMAYSIAGVIAMCGSTRKMTDYSTFMLHDASGGNGDENILDKITNSLAKIFEGTTPLTLDKTRELMSVETWMTPEDCLIHGLVDVITKTEIKKPALINRVELYEFYNKLITKTTPMRKITNHLKLTNEASEDAILDKVKEIENEADVAKAENDALAVELLEKKKEVEALEAKLAAHEASEKAVEEAAKLEVIENAVKEGKLVEDKKEDFINSPLSSESLKNLFDGIKITPEHVSLVNKVKKVIEEQSKWSFNDWVKNDPEGIREIENSNPEEFKRIMKVSNSKFQL